MKRGSDMRKTVLGRTGLSISKIGMGCLPLQRCSTDYAVKLLQAAYEGGITFYDTANAYTDSEHKIGLALAPVRSHIVIATKSTATDKEGVLEHIANSLKELRTDYIDLFQFHNVAEVPDPEDPNGAYAGAMAAKEKGYIRHIGVTTHRLQVAKACIASGCFETLQFPFSYLADPAEMEMVKDCGRANMGFIAMKGLSGGLLTNSKACAAFMDQKEFRHVVPIWGIQRQEELAQWLALAEQDTPLDEELSAYIEKDKKELAGSFCRSCGYCMPCTVGIEIRNCARMNMLLRRSPYRPYLTAEWKAKMEKIRDCVDCGLCKSRCPYRLDTPALLREMLADYEAFYAAHSGEV